MAETNMTLTFLGTGTSCGVPTIGCQCAVCRSGDPRDHRLRCSALLETPATRLLIDCGPDFRQQIMPQPFRRIDGILITHAHYDHMGGMDDVRPYCQFGEINVYADPVARQGLLQMLPYCFAANRYPGVPAIGLHEVHFHEPFTIGDIAVMPIRVMHGQLPIMGYCFAHAEKGFPAVPALVYITDMKTIDDAELPYIAGTPTLVVNALRRQPHHSHQTVGDAVAFARRVQAGRTFLIHASHDIGLHAELCHALPEGIHMAYDGLVISV